MSTDESTVPVEELSDIERMVQSAIDAGVEPKDDDDVVDPEDASVSDDERRQRWLARRQPIDHLKPGVITTVLDGVTTTLPLFDIGDRIVADVSTTLLRGNPWIYTLVGKVRSIDDDTGLVTLWDEDTDRRNPMTRYVSMRDPLIILKIAPTRGNPFDTTHVVKPRPVDLKPGEVKRGRGRPAGSKNRPKEVIRAEREAMKALRAEKRARK